MSIRALEELLYSQRKVSDVQAIGVPDAHQCEEVTASLILGQGQPMTPKEMIERRRAQVAAVTFPRHWKFVDQFPMMMTGKAQKIHHAPDRIAELGRQAAASIQTA